MHYQIVNHTYISTWSNYIKITLVLVFCNCAFSVKLYLKYLLLAVVLAVDLGNGLRWGDPTVPCDQQPTYTHWTV
jgi:hypothetical protein